MDKLNEYFNGDVLASDVWCNKYMLKAPDGTPLETTPDDMHRRMAKWFAIADGEYEDNRGKVDGLSPYGQSRQWLTEEIIYEMFKNFGFIVPQGSSMSQLGNPYSVGSLSNCFVLGKPEDSYGGICRKDEEMVQLMKRRGGVGIELSSLRPNKTFVKNSARSSTGAASFMHRYSNSTREVAQDGRRGALMLSMDIRHPDIWDFIVAKQDPTKVTGANVSVGMRSDFMMAAVNGEDYILRFPCNTECNDMWVSEDLTWDDNIMPLEYGKLTEIRNGVYIKKIKAKEYWDKIVECAWTTAEPGIIFLNNHWNYSPDGVYEQYKGVTTNPCGEIFMQAYDACRLIAKNLFSFVKDPFTPNAEIDFGLLYKMSYEQQWLGDLLVDLEIMHIDRIIDKIINDPEPYDIKKTEIKLWRKIKKVAKAGRRTGNGFTALGDMLAAINVPYDSDRALEIIDQIGATTICGELDASIDLAILRGKFEGHDPKLEFSPVGGRNYFYQMLYENFKPQVIRMNKYGRRNVSLSTIAPTGTTSLMTQTTSGMEPLFLGFYWRRKKINPNEPGSRVDFVDQNGDSWTEYPVIHPKFRQWITDVFLIELNGYQYNEDVKPIWIKHWTKEFLEVAFKYSPWYGSTANDIDWTRRVKVQSAIQKYVTHSISSTINLPNTATVDDVATIYMEAWSKDLKGVTVYRDGCRSGVLVSETAPKIDENNAPKRPDSLPCQLFRFQNNYEKWVAFVGMLDDKPYEIFTGALDSFPVPNNVDSGRIVKRRLPSGEKSYDFHYQSKTEIFPNEEYVIKGLSKAFNKEFWNYAKLISSLLRHRMPIPYLVQTIEDMSFEQEHINIWKNGVVRALKKFISNGTIIKQKCTECSGDNLIFEEGCKRCPDCGHSACN